TTNEATTNETPTNEAEVTEAATAAKKSHSHFHHKHAHAVKSVSDASPTEEHAHHHGHGHAHGDHGHGHNHDHNHKPSHDQGADHHHDHDHGIEVLEILQTSSSFVSAMILLLGLSLHNFLESLSLGASNEYKTLVAISAAICAHHYLASFSLGCAVLKAKKSLRFTWGLALVYGLTEPIGIGIGMAVKSVSESWVSAMLVCFAAGTFLFVSIVEVMVPAFEKEHTHLESPKYSPKEEIKHELTKIACVFYGFGLMSLLAVWA
ncbi:zinc permease family, partial [Reticulomyxa filosa]